MSFSFATPQTQQPQSLFPAQPSSFQPSTTSPLWPQQQQPQQQLQQTYPQQQLQLYLFTNDKTPASYSTKWADLHPDSQKFLLQIEERILEYRDESQRLDQCGRLYDSSVSSDGFELDASHVVQELGGISTSMDRQKALLHELMSSVKDMLRNTEVAIRSFVMLRPRFIHPSSAGGTSSATAPSRAPGATVAPGSNAQPSSTSIVPVFDFYTGLPKKPSVFLHQTVARFEKYLGECCQWVEELEQLLLLNYSDKNGSGFGSSLVDSLPKVISNVHDFFVHVAAKVEGIHQHIESMKTAYLADQRRQGFGSDPFLEADRRQTARQEAAAKRVHPTIHLPPIPQASSTQPAGLFSSSAAPVGSTAAPISQAAPSSGSGFSLFGTPASAPSMSSASLFTTPSTSVPSSSLFGTAGFSPQTPLFSSSSASLSGATSTPSLFNTMTSSFSSTPALGGSLFSTPFASGSAIGSGASFGATTKSSRPKSRTARR
ncbi:hypothetical protein SAY86_017987 [Trapa natans]|uniref:Nucleoporin p58/p45 n=1 Tax=Trapa natans TaxID=22666 RepID=A0AAN7R9D3_TRANT|nr:hypothetical protein SAY86_017987 [Trapa natans]